ncbi:MAG: hypothetical protein AB1705_19265 [Verrucomicrobiota bacterium]
MTPFLTRQQQKFLVAVMALLLTGLAVKVYRTATSEGATSAQTN